MWPTRGAFTRSIQSLPLHLQRNHRGLATVPAFPKSADAVGCEEFRQAAFDINRPLLLSGHPLRAIPGGSKPSVFGLLPKWFGSDPAARHHGATPYLQRFSATIFPYELVQGPEQQFADDGAGENIRGFTRWLSTADQPNYKLLAQLLEHHLDTLGPSSQDVQLLRFQAPLALLFAALDYNASHGRRRVTRLYIAQAPLNDLPRELGDDIPQPDIVKYSGKGDVYDSSIWLGLEPTYTPWHRDPNPNLFCQLCSSKVVRLLPPSAGDRIFRDVQMQLGSSGSSRIRGEEMMQGPERHLLHEAIWGESATADIQEAELDAGDALFIPKGWWHSVKSGSGDGRLNGSVNWWFR